MRAAADWLCCSAPLPAAFFAGVVVPPAVVNIPLTASFSGSLIPGTYAIDAAAAASLPVQLDCQGRKDAIFNFIIGGALGLNANVQLTNGNGKVRWAVDGAVVIAAAVKVDGDIDATGAITIGADAHVSGCARSGGALSLGALATVQCAACKQCDCCARCADSGLCPAVLMVPVPLILGCPVGNAGPGCTPCPVGSWSLADATHCTQCPGVSFSRFAFADLSRARSRSNLPCGECQRCCMPPHCVRPLTGASH